MSPFSRQNLTMCVCSALSLLVLGCGNRRIADNIYDPSLSIEDVAALPQGVTLAEVLGKFGSGTLSQHPHPRYPVKGKEATYFHFSFSPASEGEELILDAVIMIDMEKGTREMVWPIEESDR